MRLLIIPTTIAAALLSVAVSAQDTKVKARTDIKADVARVMSMTGCLRQDPLTSAYLLEGTTAAAGDHLTTKSRVKTDVDKKGSTIKGETRTTADGGAVATGGVVSTYALLPGSNVNLASHVGQRVQISAIAVKPGHGDADVKIKDKTTVDPEHARDSTSRSTTKLELPRSAAGQYTVVSVTPLGTTCTP
jgi:hypothetical protein